MSPTGTPEKPPAIFLMGPTATGKTDLAIQLCEALPCDIISVDSVMVYRGMDIGSAKPDAATLAKAPHRLINICDPAEAFSASQFRERAIHEINQILAQGRIPLLVGGTMLYYRILEHGLSPLPSAAPELRAQMEAEAEKHGWAHLHARLAEIDPEAAVRIHMNDPQRIQRALEVYELTGKSMSAWFECDIDNSLPVRPVKVLLTPANRADLHQRIEQRFHSMLEQGFLKEVEKLYQRGDLQADLPSMRAVGYRQVWAYLEGQWDYDTMVEKGIVATRQFAKRQMTWLRTELRNESQNMSELACFELNFQETHEQITSQVLKYLAANAI